MPVSPGMPYGSISRPLRQPQGIACYFLGIWHINILLELLYGPFPTKNQSICLQGVISYFLRHLTLSEEVALWGAKFKQERPKASDTK